MTSRARAGQRNLLARLVEDAAVAPCSWGAS
jgi:hypothetical protein